MILVRLNFVPPGGGEVDYGLTIRMPSLPRAGDYISVQREGKNDNRSEYIGNEDFIVRRVWWFCKFPDDGNSSHESGSEPVGTAEVCVECEFAIGPFSSVAHKRGASSGKRRSEPHVFEASNY